MWFLRDYLIRELGLMENTFIPKEEHNHLNELKNLSMLTTGTTTVGLIADNSVVLAADKRATAGFLIASRRAKKIIKLTDYAAMSISGLVADAQALADIVREEALLYEKMYKKRLSIRGLATLLSNILFSSKWFPYVVQLIVAGYDTEPRIYTLDPYGSVTEERYTATGSGSPVALGVLENDYKDNLDLDKAVELAVRAVKAAISRDAASGDGVDVAIISKDKFIEKFFPLK
jgi:proteasome beta subunit